MISADPSPLKQISIYNDHNKPSTSRNAVEVSGTFRSFGDRPQSTWEVVSSYEMQEYASTLSTRDSSIDSPASSSRNQYMGMSATRIKPSVPHIITSAGRPRAASNSEVIETPIYSPETSMSSATQSTPAKSKRFSLIRDFRPFSWAKKKEPEEPTPYSIPFLQEEDPVAATHFEYFRYTGETPHNDYRITPAVFPPARTVAHPASRGAHSHVSIREEKTLHIERSSQLPITVSTSTPTSRAQSPPLHVPQSAGPRFHRHTFSLPTNFQPNQNQYPTRTPRPLPPIPVMMSRELQQPVDGPAMV
jgi:hypothetical protein